MMKKLLLLMLSAILVLNITACGFKSTSKTNPNEQVTLKWIMPGPGEQKDSPKVWDEFNKRLKTYPGMQNVTVDIEVINSADYQQKFLLLQTSGEPIDIVQTYTLDFAKEARNESFMPMDDLLKLVPDLQKELPDWMWNLGKVDGKQYIVPIYQQMVSAPWGIKTPKALADQFADVNKMQDTFNNSDYFDESCYNALEDYLIKMKNAGKLGLGFNSGTQSTKGYETIVNPYGYKISDGDNIKVVNLQMAEGSKLKYMKVGEWFQKGYIRKDALSAKRSDDDGKVGGNSVWIGQCWKGTEQTDLKTYGFDTTSIKLSNDYFVPFTPEAGGTAIMSNSKYPDVAMKVIELMNTEKGKDLYNLLVYGLEGQHYNKINDDKIETIGYVNEGTSAANYGLWKWVVGNCYYAWDTQVTPDGWKDYVYNELNKGPNTKYSKLMGFSPDLSKIESKIAQVKAVNSQYGGPLGTGAVENYKEYYDEFVRKMEMCGNQDIINELQRQVDEFLASK